MKGMRNIAMSKFYQLYPKPEAKNKNGKKKKVNGYKDKPQRTCYYCGTPYAERHEVYGGPNRQISIDLGFQVDLCRECHSAWHRQEDFKWVLRKVQWQQHYQTLYENKLINSGIRPDQARECWMKLIGRNYLDG